MAHQPHGMALMVGMASPKGAPPGPPAQDDEPMPGMPDEDDQDQKNYTVDVPEGFEPPNDVQDGDEFDFTGRGYIKDGKLRITSLNGIKTGMDDQDGSGEGDENDSKEGEESDSQPQTLDDAMDQELGKKPMGKK